MFLPVFFQGISFYSQRDNHSLEDVEKVAIIPNDPSICLATQ